MEKVLARLAKGELAILSQDHLDEEVAVLREDCLNFEHGHPLGEEVEPEQSPIRLAHDTAV